MSAHPLTFDAHAFLASEGFCAETQNLTCGVQAWRAPVDKLWALENCVIRSRAAVHATGGVLLAYMEAAAADANALWLFENVQAVDLFPALCEVGFLAGASTGVVEQTARFYSQLCGTLPSLSPTRLAPTFVNLRCLDGQVPKALALEALQFSRAVHGYQLDLNAFDTEEQEAHYWSTKGSLILGA
ncbi:MAG: hypothetical protein ACFBZ8_00850 [Opitutales bacterium]